MKWRWYHYIILIIALLFTAILVYSPHFNYKYPFRVDEWNHIAQGIHYLDKGFQEDLNFTNYPKNMFGSIDYEIGSNLLLSFLFLFIDPVLHTKYLPALFAILAGIVLFYFLYKSYNFWTGIFAILFFASLKSNINISGPWFLVPQVMVFPLFFLFLFLFENQKTWWSLFVYFIIFSMHPLTAFILFPIISFYSLINFKKYKTFWITTVLILIIIFLICTKILWQGSISLTYTHFTDILLFKAHPKNIIKFFIPTFYGLLSFLFAIIAFIPLIKKRKFLLPIAIIITLTSIFIYDNFNIHIFAPFSRTFYTSLLLLVPASAIGLNYTIKKLRKFPYSKLIIILLLVLTFINAFYSYYPTEQKLKPYHLIEDSDYETLKWLENNFGIHNKIIVPARLKEVLYPITKNYPHHSRFITGNPANFDFFNKTCDERYIICKWLKVRFIIAEEPIGCEDLISVEKVYQKDNLYIYKTTC